VKLLYFAWLRTRIGKAEETLEPPQGVRSVAALVDWLETRGPAFAAALGNRKLLRVAVNKEYVGWDHKLNPGDEVALFPPVTGG
jgi:sulfur-carrier protein